jgi:hypothetical protein
MESGTTTALRHTLQACDTKAFRAPGRDAAPTSDVADDGRAAVDTHPRDVSAAGRHLTDEDINSFVARTTAASGVSLFLEDLSVIDEVARVLSSC